jgi:hypothetical protein
MITTTTQTANVIGRPVACATEAENAVNAFENRSISASRSHSHNDARQMIGPAFVTSGGSR